MALSDRKKTALGFLITGIVFVAVGFILWFTQTNPAWLQKALLIVGAVVEIIGLSVTLPNVT